MSRTPTGPCSQDGDNACIASRCVVQFGFNIYFGTAEIVDVPPSTGTPIGCDATIIDTSPWVKYGVAGDGGTTYRACVALKTTEVIDGSADMIAPMIRIAG